MNNAWSDQNTTPSKIDDALRTLLYEHAQEDRASAPARVLNLVVIVDHDFSGEVENRLERVGRFHPSRTIVCEVERRRDTLDAWATISSEENDGDGIDVFEERIEIVLGEKHLQRIDSVVDQLLVSDLQTVVWSPHGHDDAVDSLRSLTDVILIDSIEAASAEEGVERAASLLRSAYVVDLAWIRSMPWRERIAATFDPPRWRGALREISAVEIRHHPDSQVPAALLAGWLASRLDWDPVKLEHEDGGLVGRARGHGRRVRVRLEPDSTMPVPGLAGITIEAASGLRLSLDRGPGGLHAKRKAPGAGESEWVVLGASRGESGILGEGIRQALLREPTYGAAVEATAKMLR